MRKGMHMELNCNSSTNSSKKHSGRNYRKWADFGGGCVRQQYISLFVSKSLSVASNIYDLMIFMTEKIIQRLDQIP
jgi:hypothetical protein